ncbi:MAG: hydrolase [Syntrophomonadaceae bacterium]|jgi:nicotinamidase-related amidase|nr:hydrolase [Syntrophomonadaceae bacterium]
MSKYSLSAENTVLLGIDYQERLMPAVLQPEKVSHNIGLLLQLAEKLDIPVIITEQYPRGLGRTVPEVKQYLGEHQLIEKITFSAMIPELEKHLEQLGRRQIVVGGVEAHICVFQTVRDMVEAGFEVHLVRNACSSRFEENYLSALELMRDLGAVITTAETVIFDLLKIAGTPEFRAMSQLVK